MIQVKIKTNIAELTRSLDEFQKRQIPFAIAKTATAVAGKIKAEQEKALPSIFDRPSLFTQRAIGVKPARKSNPVATIYVKDITARYLEPFEFGGKHLLPKSKRGGTFMNPKNVTLNQYGNLSKGQLKRLSARPDVHVGTIKTRSGQTVNGLWQRPATAGAKGRGANRSGALKLLVRFGDALPVQPRMRWFERAAAVSDEVVKAEFTKAFADALATAKLTPGGR